MAGKKIGLALGSGAVRGYALIPIIKRLEKENIEISAISGSSVGALIGAYYALHGEIDSLFDHIKTISRRDYLKLVDPNNPKISLFKGKKIRKFLSDNYFHEATFEDVKIRLTVCATDPFGKKPDYLTDGQLIDAVMASISIPGLVPPYKIGKKFYVDGGVMDPVPTQPLLDAGLKKVVGVNLMGFKSNQRKNGNTGLIPTLMNTFYMMMEQMARKEDNHRLFVLNPRFEPDPARMLAFHEWEENYEIGKKLIEKRIGDLRKWLQS